MGHLAGKDLYRKLGRKIDNLTMRAPWNETFYNILKELYSTDEAEVAVKMPYGFGTFEQILTATGYDAKNLRKIVDSLCAKGLVVDIWASGRYYYMLSPLIVGIFEFTMMRTGDGLNTTEWARLFHDYMQGDGTFYSANLSAGQKVMPLRALPYEDTIDNSEFVEILDYEKTTAIIDNARDYAVGICSCRHEKLHVGAKTCNIPLETCTTLGSAGKFMAKRNFAKLISKSEMLENLSRFKEMGLVVCADNVQNDVSFLCFCCGCCCNVLQGISKFGYPNTVVTSTFIAQRFDDNCAACGACVDSCPIKAVEMRSDNVPVVDEKICMGCGVCGVKCPSGAMRLVKRQQRVLHPETTFQRVILQSLERGTLQNLIFGNTQRVTHKFMRAFIGGFLKLPPVKKALMSDTLRSSFLRTMEKRG